ncbi:MAG TPA: hypothetical protein VFB38_01935 [Chthonomonadaceae bacterium]|nr:hypothetical protein [Chthonomonadaceae bacterium]
MDPISISIELELGALLIAAVGAVATWLHNRHHKANRRQRERHYRQMRAQEERHHRERLAALHTERGIERSLETMASAPKRRSSNSSTG